VNVLAGSDQSNIRSLFDIPEVEQRKIPPNAGNTTDALSRIGYEIEESLADLVDNSIDANAKNVLIRFYFTATSLERVAIVDDGHGLSPEDFDLAMQLGAETQHKPTDLGKFGVGLKTASLSQCNSFSVLSRVKSAFDGRRLTMESMDNDWTCYVLGPRQVRRFMTQDWGDVNVTRSGTVVLWDDLRISNADKNINRLIRQLYKQIKGHLGLVFHRFISSGKINIAIDSRNIDTGATNPSQPVIGLDPFEYRKTGRRGYPRDFRIPISDAGQVTLTANAHIWPPNSPLPGYKLGGGRTASRQGLYFYRNDRLIQAGGWNGIRDNDSEPHLSLARVQINLTPESDRVLRLNIQKSHIDVLPSIMKNSLDSARSHNKTFNQFIQDAQDVYRGAVKSEAPIAVAGSGFPPGVRRETRRLSGSKRKSQFPIQIRWFKRMNDDTVFTVDRERQTLRLNERYRSQLEGAGGSDSTIKALVFLLVSEEFGRTRVRASHDNAIDRLNIVLLAAMEA